ncbi:hypothetical protein [Mucilaginibacter pedocola]|uniref:Uncharacterized protein n=1 Tax=Mucilaginibacter pedocola TaxID=1792845 RepID=A0A1S9PBE5_9SPHI|nr:hypothetical protein [Mucilaginibacter pedocola]OOQ57938.1 hypothetical protein BC343_09680 [Mucilaginibacter pedocola]
MKKIAVPAISIFLLANALNTSAQSFDVPKNYVLKTKDDYARYEPEIIKTANWLQQTPWKQQPVKMEEANQFLLKWAKGTPVVTIRLIEAVMDLSDRNPQLGFVFMAQFSKYALEHREGFDTNKANIAAIRAVIEKYRAEPTHKSDEDIEYLIGLEDKGELDDWVISTFATEGR